MRVFFFSFYFFLLCIVFHTPAKRAVLVSDEAIGQHISPLSAFGLLYYDDDDDYYFQRSRGGHVAGGALMASSSPSSLTSRPAPSAAPFLVHPQKMWSQYLAGHVRTDSRRIANAPCTCFCVCVWIFSRDSNSMVIPIVTGYYCEQFVLQPKHVTCCFKPSNGLHKTWLYDVYISTVACCWYKKKKKKKSYLWSYNL